MTKRLVAHHAIVPFTFRISGQPLDPEISPLISARCAGDITLRLVAQQQQSAATRPTYADSDRPNSARGPASTTFTDRCGSGLHPDAQHPDRG
jgi:hypothetical protein